jgi:hypothetical protein
MKSEKIISLSRREFNSKLSKEDLKWAIELNWTETIWKPKDALVEMSGGSNWLYTGQTFDNGKVKLVKNGWTHDHCDICFSNIRKKDSCAVSENQIICTEYHNNFIKNKI